MAIRPPFMSQGQANDAYALASLGTGLAWLAGGVAAGPAALALGLFGAGAIANNCGPNHNDPHMQFTGSGARPPEPLSYPTWTPEIYEAIGEMESRLVQNYGQNAVYCFRRMACEGYTISDAFETLMSLLNSLKAKGYWRNGRIESANASPKALFDRLLGRRVASPELQEWFGDQFFQSVWHNLLKHRPTQEGRETGATQMAIMIYILGLTPVTDKPVCRLKWWPDRRPRMPLFYAADWKWYSFGPIYEFRERWERILDRRINVGMPLSLVDEADDLYHYRIEEHRGDAPPGHPGHVLWSSVIFEREKPFPATEEDMRGKL